MALTSKHSTTFKRGRKVENSNGWNTTTKDNDTTLSHVHSVCNEMLFWVHWCFNTKGVFTLRLGPTAQLVCLDVKHRSTFAVAVVHFKIYFYQKIYSVPAFLIYCVQENVDVSKDNLFWLLLKLLKETSSRWSFKINTCGDTDFTW